LFVTLINNTNVFNVAIQLTSNGTVVCTLVEAVIELPLDTHQRHVEDPLSTMESMAVTTSKGDYDGKLTREC
jgi:hypothetical protein